MIAYDTISEAVEGLKDRGYDLDFNLTENCLICQDKKYKAEDFKIVEFHRFEGDSDPSDEAVVYAIESKDHEKGMLVTGYGVSAEGMSADMVRKLSLAD